jgi:murein DD-endopeptidase MepM/ murein hydrolase activator NlpD
MVFIASVSSVATEATVLEIEGSADAFRGPVIRLDVTMATPGGVVRVVALEPGLVDVVLQDEGGVSVSRAAVMTMRAGEIGRAQRFLLPLSTTLRPGEYFVVARNGVEDRAHVPVRVVERLFLSQEIALNRRLTDLRSLPDPEKDRQTRELSELVLSRDAAAVHHSGPLSWPLPRESRETSAYGVRRRYLYNDGSDARSIHVGVDLAAPTGTAVRSSGDGIVRMAEFRIVTGWTVVVEHLPGVYSLYYHLSNVVVEKGELVSSGQELGRVGATGLATGAHLHWEVRVAGVPVDPIALTIVPLL